MCVEYLFGNLKAYYLKSQAICKYDNPNGMYDALVLTVPWRHERRGEGG